jgi:hypothetical protein
LTVMDRLLPLLRLQNAAHNAVLGGIPHSASRSGGGTIENNLQRGLRQNGAESTAWPLVTRAPKALNPKNNPEQPARGEITYSLNRLCLPDWVGGDWDPVCLVSCI